MKIVYRIMPLLLLIAFTSCEESISPKGQIEDEYVLNAQLNFNIYWDQPSSIIAYITKVYDVEGLDPSVQEEIPTYSAEMFLIYDNQEIPFTKTYRRKSSQDIKIPRSSYFISKILRQNTDVQIKAVLPNGRVLKAETRLPLYKNFERNYPFVSGLTTEVDSALYYHKGRKFELSWKSQLNHSYLGKFELLYEYNDGDSIKKYLTKEIPSEYVKNGDKMVAIYPNVDDYSSCSFHFNAIDKVISEIVEEGKERADYKLLGFNFSLLEYDANFSLYYASTESSMDEYSIRTNKSVYSNINGGYGIFGSKIEYSHFVKINYHYAVNLGFQPPDIY